MTTASTNPDSELPVFQADLGATFDLPKVEKIVAEQVKEEAHVIEETKDQ